MVRQYRNRLASMPFPHGMAHWLLTGILLGFPGAPASSRLRRGIPTTEKPAPKAGWAAKLLASRCRRSQSCSLANKTVLRLASLTCLVVGFTLAGPLGSAEGQPAVLKGKVEQKNQLQRLTSPPGIPSGDDPFGNASGGGDPFTPGGPPPPVSTASGPGDTFSATWPTEPQAPPRKAYASRQEPDESPELQVAWDEWHRRIGEAVFARFNQMSKAAFKYSEPLACKVSYTVTRDGQIKDIKILEQSPNMMFNLLVTTVLKSIAGDHDLLQFPEGSHRMEVEKSGTFTQNYGMEGFRYKTGDKEAVRAKGK